METLYLIGFIQSIFFSFLILTKKSKLLTDYLLSIYLIVMGSNLLFINLNLNGSLSSNPLIILIDFAYWTLIGPLLYLYIELSSSQKKQLKWKHLIHLFPTIIIFIAFSDYILNHNQIIFWNYKSDSSLFEFGYYVWMYNSPIYYLLCIYKIRSHKKKIKSFYSNTLKRDLKWLNYLVHGFAFFLWFLLFNNSLWELLNLNLKISSMHYTWGINVVYIFGIGFFGYKQEGIFNTTIKAQDNTISIVTPSKNRSYIKSGLKEDERNDLIKKLDSYLKDSKPYLNYDLNLRTMAEELNTSTHKLSQLINEEYEQSFFDFINSFRLKKVKEMLEDEKLKNEKIMALAYDCGFNSKSAFYNIFKKSTSLTPSEYRSKNLKKLEAV